MEFEELLIDHDKYLNAGNWLWVSQYYKVYNPTNYAKKYDPTGTFIRYFVPELRTFPSSHRSARTI